MFALSPLVRSPLRAAAAARAVSKAQGQRTGVEKSTGQPATRGWNEPQRSFMLVASRGSTIPSAARASLMIKKEPVTTSTSFAEAAAESAA
jgi:hypothetical protein